MCVTKKPRSLEPSAQLTGISTTRDPSLQLSIKQWCSASFRQLGRSLWEDSKNLRPRSVIFFTSCGSWASSFLLEGLFHFMKIAIHRLLSHRSCLFHCHFKSLSSLSLNEHTNSSTLSLSPNNLSSHDLFRWLSTGAFISSIVSVWFPPGPSAFIEFCSYPTLTSLFHSTVCVLWDFIQEWVCAFFHFYEWIYRHAFEFFVCNFI